MGVEDAVERHHNLLSLRFGIALLVHDLREMGACKIFQERTKVAQVR